MRYVKTINDLSTGLEIERSQLKEKIGMAIRATRRRRRFLRILMVFSMLTGIFFLFYFLGMQDWL